MNNLPKVSIIATFYNSSTLGDFVHKSMDSLLDQTYQNIEFIFVNDGSQDDTLTQLEEYQRRDDRITIINKKNEGTAQYAKAAGQDAATGDYIMLFDHDDELSNNAVETAVSTFLENPSLEMVAFIVEVCFENKKLRSIYSLDDVLETREHFKNKIISGEEALKKTVGYYDFNFRGLYKKEVFKKKSFKFTEKLLNADEIVERELLENVKHIGNCKGIYTHYIYSNSSAKSFNLKKTDIVVTDLYLREYFKKLGYYKPRKSIFEKCAYQNLINAVKAVVFFENKIISSDLEFYKKRLRASFNKIDKKVLLETYTGINKFYHYLLTRNFVLLYLFYKFKNIFTR